MDEGAPIINFNFAKGNFGEGKIKIIIGGEGRETLPENINLHVGKFTFSDRRTKDDGRKTEDERRRTVINMAIFHCTISNISRAKGSSTCATAAYITGQKIYEDRTGQTYNYGRKQRVFDFESAGLDHVILPEGVPESFNSVSNLANAIENYELADNARCAKKEEFSLPVEATTKQKIAIARKHIDDCYTSKGYACIWAIHDIDGDNPHAHIIIINRKINEQGEFEKFKAKTVYARDENGEKIPVYETQRDETGKILKDEHGKRLLVLDSEGNPIQAKDKNGKLSYKRTKVEMSYLDQKDLVKTVRQNCEACINEILPEEKKVDCRSLKEQGINREPTIHEGYAARAMDKRYEEEQQAAAKEGRSANPEIQPSERCALNEGIKERNSFLKTLQTEVTNLRQSLQQTLTALLSQIALQRLTLNGLSERLSAGIANARRRDVERYHSTHEYDPSHDYAKDPETIQYAQVSDNPLATQIIHADYEPTAENMKAVAESVGYLQNHNISSRADFRRKYNALTDTINRDLKEYTAINDSLAIAEKKLECRGTVNRNRAVYDEYSNKKIGKDKFREKHRSELEDYEVARHFLRENDPRPKPEPGEKRKLQTAKEIQAEVKTLIAEKKKATETFRKNYSGGYTMQDFYNSLDRLLGSDPDAPEWHPVDTLRYNDRDKLPRELQVDWHQIREIPRRIPERPEITDRDRNRDRTITKTKKHEVDDPPFS